MEEEELPPFICTDEDLVDSARIDAWLLVHRPRHIHRKITVQTKHYQPPDIATVTSIWQSHIEQSIPTQETLDLVALESGGRAGKWLVFMRDDAVDNLWPQLVHLLLSGQLGNKLKVSPSNKYKGKFFVGVSTDDYFDYEDVMRVRDSLRSIGFGYPLWYKPMVYTVLGINDKNPWQLEKTHHSA